MFYSVSVDSFFLLLQEYLMSSETLTASTGIQAQEAEEAEKVGVGQV